MTTKPADSQLPDTDSIPHAGEGARSALFALLRRQRQKPGEPTSFQDTLPVPDHRRSED